jgi:hypothetical protein
VEDVDAAENKFMLPSVSARSSTAGMGASFVEGFMSSIGHPGAARDVAASKANPTGVR